MTRPLNVLLIETNPGVGSTDASRLELAGHRVHRCYHRLDQTAEARQPTETRSLCTGVTDGTCPIDGGIDVALMVRPRLAPRPSGSEGGVSCALRSGIPVVEDGPEVLDPYDPWLAGRVGDDPVAACEEAAEASFSPLRLDIARRIAPVLRAAGIAPDTVAVNFETSGTNLRAMLTGPSCPTAAIGAMAVRVHDAVRAGKRSFRGVDVSYRPVRETESGRSAEDEDDRDEDHDQQRDRKG